MSTPEIRDRLMAAATERINKIREGVHANVDEGYFTPEEAADDIENVNEFQRILASMEVANAARNSRNFATLAKDLYDKTMEYEDYFMESSHESDGGDFEVYFNPDTHHGFPDDYDEEFYPDMEFYNNRAWDVDTEDDYFDAGQSPGPDPNFGPEPIDLSQMPDGPQPDLDLDDAAREYRDSRSLERDNDRSSRLMYPGPTPSPSPEPRQPAYSPRRGRGRLR